MAKRKLTKSLIERIIKEERAKLGMGGEKPVEKKAKETKEVDADEYGTSKALEKDIDHAKVLKIKEHAYRKALKMLREEKAKRAPKKKSVKMNESQLVEALKQVRAQRAKIRKKITERI